MISDSLAKKGASISSVQNTKAGTRVVRWFCVDEPNITKTQEQADQQHEKWTNLNIKRNTTNSLVVKQPFCKCSKES